MRAVPAMTPFQLWSQGSWPQVDVVGESHYESHLRELLATGGVEGESRTVDTIAVLMPEPRNRFDPNAVAVLVQKGHVGYLSRADAARYSPLLRNLIERNRTPEVPCRIWGYERQVYAGTDRRGRDTYSTELHASVHIALDEPHLCVPVNDPPTAPNVELPYGNAVQVTGEENHMDAITPFLGPEGKRWAYATLHGVTEQLARGTRDVVEVRLDGRRVGQLTPKMSSEFLPAVGHLDGLGYETVARVLVTGNRLKAEIALHALRAHQLDAGWPGVEAITRPPTDTPAPVASSVSVARSPEPVLEPATTATNGGCHRPLPPKPTRIRFNPPPGWPAPGPGTEPQPGWTAPDDWPVAPDGWAFWIASDEK